MNARSDPAHGPFASCARLMVITDTAVAAVGVLENRIERTLSAAAPRSVIVQLRDLSLPVRDRLSLGRRLVAQCRRHEQWLIVNDRCDVAVLLSADGVHLGERGVDATDARAVLGPEGWISRANHDPDRIETDALNAVVLSPIFAPRKGRAARGAAALRQARMTLDATSRAVLLYALGGVDANNAAAALSAGADGVAITRAVLDGSDPLPLLRALDIAR